MSNDPAKEETNNGKEVIVNALLEASQNLLTKIENNVNKINGLGSQLNGGTYQRKKKEKVGTLGPEQVQTYIPKE